MFSELITPELALRSRCARGLVRGGGGADPCEDLDLLLDLFLSFGVDACVGALEAAGAEDEDFLLPLPILGRAPEGGASSAASLECFLTPLSASLQCGWAARACALPPLLLSRRRL